MLTIHEQLTKLLPDLTIDIHQVLTHLEETTRSLGSDREPTLPLLGVEFQAAILSSALMTSEFDQLGPLIEYLSQLKVRTRPENTQLLLEITNALKTSPVINSTAIAAAIELLAWMQTEEQK